MANMLPSLGYHLGGNNPPSCAKGCGLIFGAGLPSGGTLVLQYLHDFMVLGRDKRLVREFTREWSQMLAAKGFIVSEKSTLEPTQQLKWL